MRTLFLDDEGRSVEEGGLNGGGSSSVISGSLVYVALRTLFVDDGRSVEDGGLKGGRSAVMAAGSIIGERVSLSVSSLACLLGFGETLKVSRRLRFRETLIIRGGGVECSSPSATASSGMRATCGGTGVMAMSDFGVSISIFSWSGGVMLVAPTAGDSEVFTFGVESRDEDFERFLELEPARRRLALFLRGACFF